MPRRILAFALLLSTLSPLPALAEPSDGDKAAFKALVSEQIAAFKRDDGAAAYSKAAPGIQAMFPSPEQFLGMVRQAYPPVYRPSTIAFGEVADTPAGPVEKVYITAADGTNWIALYRFQKQPDGSWKISGCQLLKDTAPTI